MKGPYERLKYDGRRVWECPECKHRERTECHVVNLMCDCQKKKLTLSERVSMKLVEDNVRRVV